MSTMIPVGRYVICPTRVERRARPPTDRTTMPNVLRLSDRPVVVQILARFAVLCAVIAALAATQHVAVQRLSHRTADVGRLAALGHQVDDLRYDSMLLSGWQGYAAWSISREG